MSNTKLDKIQKTERKAFIAELQRSSHYLEFFHFPEKSLTIGVMRGNEAHRMAHVAVSTCAPEEQKFRPKVGEYHVAKGLLFGMGIQVPIEAGVEGDFARELADTIENNCSMDYVREESGKRGWPVRY